MQRLLTLFVRDRRIDGTSNIRIFSDILGYNFLLWDPIIIIRGDLQKLNLEEYSTMGCPEI
jgi:hypothetical protein